MRHWPAGRYSETFYALRSAFYVWKGPLTLREEPSGRANLCIMHFENTGHLLHRDRFPEFVTQVRQFFAAHEGQSGRQTSDA